MLYGLQGEKNNMVEVIENKAIRLCRCQYCDSLLRFTLADGFDYHVKPGETLKNVIKCPACGGHTHTKNTE